MSYRKLHDQDFVVHARTGVDANLEATATLNTAVEGEPHWATDNQRLYIYSAVLAQMIAVAMYDANGCLQLPVFTDGTRPAAGTAGRLIFNSDDGLINIDDGTNWTLPDGTTT
jgi:hypothetical protein